MERVFILIILVFYLYILLLNRKENLINISKYRMYELGDIIKGYIAKKNPSKYNNYSKMFPNTIASKYIEEIRYLPPNQKWNNIKVLQKLTKDSNPLDVSLHLRTGDILGEYNLKKKKFNRFHKKIYFYQPSVYEKIFKDLKKKK